MIYNESLACWHEPAYPTNTYYDKIKSQQHKAQQFYLAFVSKQAVNSHACKSGDKTTISKFVSHQEAEGLEKRQLFPL